jgi:hypothetical protein
MVGGEDAVPGCRDLVRDGVEGLLVPPGDAAAPAAALTREGRAPTWWAAKMPATSCVGPWRRREPKWPASLLPTGCCRKMTWKSSSAVWSELSPDLAQDLSTDVGKLIRVDPDGSTPPDNPFANHKLADVGREVLGKVRGEPVAG